MKLLRLVDQTIIYPYSIGQLTSDFPNTSFPENLDIDTLLKFGVHQVLYITKPDEPLKNISEGTPTKIGEDYYENWIVTDCTPEEIAIRLDRQWSDVRYQRNQSLSECDWTQLPDSPLTSEKKEEWVVYRQDLRDVTLQPDPFNITWPTKPQ
jgi:hypothetical protein